MEGTSVIRSFVDNEKNLNVSLTETPDGCFCIDLHIEDVDKVYLVFQDLLKIAVQVSSGDYNCDYNCKF